MEKAHILLNKYLNDNDIVVIGVSGGPDSMVLLSLILELKKDLIIICAHINHNVRKESFDEAIMVENFCAKNNVIFKQMTIENYETGNFENQAREKRYRFYESLIKEYGAKYLLTAHHGDDLMETMLMRIVRGSTLKGYSAFSEYEKRNNYILLRPLIHNTKDEILSYAIENHIPYAIDSSNSDESYTRNRYRKNILPILKKEKQNVHEKFYELSKILKETDEFIKIETENKLKECFIKNKLYLNYFNNYPVIIKREIIRKILSDIYKSDIKIITNKHIIQILEINKPNCSLDLPKGIKIHKSYDYITFEKAKTKSEYRKEIIDKVDLPNGKSLKVSTSVKDTSNDVIRLSKNEIDFPLYVRNRKDGDRILLKGLNHHKKIKDILIDEKIPRHERDSIPVVEDKNGVIVWIPGLKKSKFDKEKNENCDIIVKYI